MRDRLLRHLAQAAGPLRAEQVLRDALGIVSPNALAAERVLRGLVGGDPRFVRDGRGYWTAGTAPAPVPAEPTTAAFLHVEPARVQHGSWFGRGAVWLPGIAERHRFEILPAPGAALLDAAARARATVAGRMIVCWSTAVVHEWRRLLAAWGLPAWTGEALRLRPLAARVLGTDPPAIDPTALAATLGLSPPDAEFPEAVARFLEEALHALLDRAPDAPRALGELPAWIEAARPRVDFRRFAFGPDLLDRIPAEPGVYVMRDGAGDAIYVGKARNLARRVRSYFTPRGLGDPKIARIHASLRTLEWRPLESEVEALLVETRLIRTLRPRVNLQSEVHERSPRYGRHANLLLLVPAAPALVRVYLLHQGGFVGRIAARLGSGPDRRLLDRVRRTYFPESPARLRRRPAWEAELVARWLRTHRRRLNVVDIDAAGTFEAVRSQLGSFLRDPDRLARKVYYI